MNQPLKIAFYTTKHKFIHIDEADNGENCNCTCPKCKEPLIAKNNGKLRTHHFSHKVETNCTGSQMTALHFLAQQIIVENEEIIIAENKMLGYINGIAEKPFLTIRPDVTVISEEIEICFEVWVNNRKDEETKKLYIDNKRRCIEIDLSKLPLESTLEEIKFAVLNDYTNKAEIGWIDLAQGTIENITETGSTIAQQGTPEKSFWKPVLTVLGIIAAAWVFINFVEWLFTSPKRIRR